MIKTILIPFLIPILTKISIVFLGFFLALLFCPRDESIMVCPVFVPWFLLYFYSIIELIILFVSLGILINSDASKNKDYKKKQAFFYGICISSLPSFIYLFYYL